MKKHLSVCRGGNAPAHRLMGCLAALCIVFASANYCQAVSIPTIEEHQAVRGNLRGSGEPENDIDASIKPPAGPVELSLTPGVFAGAPVPRDPVSLSLDDGSCDYIVGVSRQFLYLNQFTPEPGEYPFVLNQVQVYFSSYSGGASNVNVGDDFMVVIYENTDNFTNPAVGSNLLATFPATVKAVDAWNVYSLAAPVRFYGPGDVLIGVIALEVPQEGVLYSPAALDMSIGYLRAWYGYWSSSPPPNPPTLPPDERWTNLNKTGLWGSWLIRGSGVTGTCIDADNDTYGDNCTAGPDCDDSNPVVNPGAVEACNEKDDNCNGQTDEGCSSSTTTTPASCIDQDGDGYGAGCAAGADCDDVDASVHDTCTECSVLVFPRRIGRLIGERDATRRLLVIGGKDADYDENTPVSWNTGALEILDKQVFLKRFMLMKVRIDGARLAMGDYTVTADSCTGTVHMVR